MNSGERKTERSVGEKNAGDGESKKRGMEGTREARKENSLCRSEGSKTKTTTREGRKTLR